MKFDVTFSESNNGLRFRGEKESGLLNDAVISEDSTWSSKGIVDKIGLFHNFAESGAVVACDPVAGYPLEVVSHIVPKQEGSGDPSLSNIRPITGYDSVKLSRTGKNLLKYPYYDRTGTYAGVTFTDNGDGSVTLNGTPTAASSALFTFEKADFGSLLKDGVTYCLSGGTTDDNLMWLFIYTDAKGNTYYPRNKVTWRSEYTLRQIFLQIQQIKTYDNLVVYPQLEVGEAATDYEPYRGDELTIELGQTVYGGKFNWQTGELTIDRETLVFDGVDIRCEWLGTANGNSFVYRTIKPANSAFPLCSHLKPSYAQEYGNVGISNPNVDGLIAYIQPFADGQEANAWLAEQYAKGTPFTVCYELKNPLTVKLTPQEILALSGTNYISSNTGNTDVAGRVAPSTIINNLLNRIAALEAAVVNNA